MAILGPGILLDQGILRKVGILGRGILDSGSEVEIILTAPDGVYAGAQAIVTGGTTIVYVDGEYAPITAEVGESIIPYMFIINGVETGVWFESPTTFPSTLLEGDTIQAKDALGNLSNILTAGDPLTGIVFALRLQTHNGNGTPLGLYQDEACTTPSTTQGDPVVAMRDEITESGVVAIDNGSVQEAYLDFIGGVPTVRTTINTRFEIASIAGYFDGDGGISIGYEVISEGDSQAIVGCSDGTGYNGHFDRFFATGTAFSQMFFNSHRADGIGTSPETGKHTISTTHNGTDWKRYVDGVQSGATVSEQAFGFYSANLFFMGGFTDGGNQEGRLIGLIAGPAWSDSDRGRVEDYLVSLQPKEVHIAFFGDSNTEGSTIGTQNSYPAKLEGIMLDRRILCDSHNLGGSGTTAQNWADGIVGYIGFLDDDDEYVTVMLGTNDANTDHHSPKATYKVNVEIIVQAIIETGRKPVLIPPPYPVPGALGIMDELSPVLVTQYIAALQELASEIEGCHFYDTGLYEYTQADPATMTDGIHLTPETSEWLAGKLAIYFQPMAS